MPGNTAFVAEPYLDGGDRTIQSAKTGCIVGMFIESMYGYGGRIEMPHSFPWTRPLLRQAFLRDEPVRVGQVQLYAACEPAAGTDRGPHHD